jgi:hypothetical protein
VKDVRVRRRASKPSKLRAKKGLKRRGPCCGKDAENSTQSRLPQAPPFIGLKGDEAEWLSCNVYINLGLCMSSLAYLVHDSKAESARLVGD